MTDAGIGQRPVVPVCPRCCSAASVRPMIDSSGGTRMRRGGRQAKAPEWKTARAYYCRECHAELHELRCGDWEVGYVDAHGGIARTEVLPPAMSTETRCALTFLRASLAGGRAAAWADLLREGRAAGFGEHTLRRARHMLGAEKRWPAIGRCLWALPEHGGQTVSGEVPVRKWDYNFAHGSASGVTVDG